MIYDPAEVADDYQPIAETTEIERRFRQQAATALADLSRQEREQIATRAARLASIFLSGTLDEYREALAEQGLPATGWMTDEAGAQQSWSLSQSKFDPAVLDLDGIRMHAPKTDMYIKGVPGLKNVVIARASSKPQGPGDVNPFAPDAALRDVVVPVTMTTAEGTTFQGELVLGFGRRESDGEWVIAYVRINDIPSNESIHWMMI